MLTLKKYWPFAALVAAFVVVFLRAPSAGEFAQFTVLGLAEGAVFAIAASGIVLTYTTTGVFNFAHGAVGMLSAYVYWTLLQKLSIPAPLALLLVLAGLAPLVGLVLERIMRSFKDAGAGTTLTVTIALTVLLIGVGQYLFPSKNEVRDLKLLFGNRSVEILGAVISWDSIFFVFVAIAVAMALRLLLFVSRTGTAMRAVVDNADLAALNGAPPRLIARYAWIAGSVIAAISGVLFAGGQVLVVITLTFFVINAYGAAVFGRLKSLPLTFAGGLLLGLAKNYASFALPSGDFWSKIAVSVPGIFLFAALLALPEDKLSVGRLVGRDEPAVPGVVKSLIASGALVATFVVLSHVISEDYLPDLTRGVIYGVLMLSLVLLTGYSGQISLAQYVFLGLGAFAMGKVADGHSALGMLAAAAIAVPVGAIVALPALRLRGLYLALVTFALAAVSKALIFQQPQIYGSSNLPVGRLKLFGLDFGGARAFLFLCSIVFCAVGMGVLFLRRGEFGRRLAALRDSEAACATLGLDVRRTKLTVFVISAAIAGLAGALFGGLNTTAGDIQFEPENNIVLFLFAYVGGITTITGALIGGILFALLPLVQSKAIELAGLVFASVAVAAILLGRQPNGMAGLLFERANGWRTALRGGRDPAALTRSATPKEVTAGAAGH